MPAFLRSSVGLSCSPTSRSRFHQPPDSSGNESIAAAKRPSSASSAVDEPVDLGAHVGQQRGVAGDRVRVDEDRQRHQALRIGPEQPVAHDAVEVAGAAPPGRVADHDAARAVRVAEVAQRRREAPARLGDLGLAELAPSRRIRPLSWSVFSSCSPRPSLPITNRQLSATSAARRDQLPGALEQLGVERLHQLADLADPACRRGTAARRSARSCRPARRSASRSCACTICTVIRYEWFDRKLSRSSCSSSPTTRSPSATTSRCTWCSIISASASNSGASGAIETSSKRRQLAHRQRVERAPVDDRALQPGVREDAEPRAVAHQHAAACVAPASRARRRRCRSPPSTTCAGPQERLGDPRRRQRLHLALAVALRQRAELVRQVREQQRAERGVARDQRR